MMSQELLTHNIDSIYPSADAFKQKLDSGKKLTFYIGIDPNIPHVHLGHAIVYKKLEQFRQLGHTVICLVGDFTARIGDPTDKSAARAKLTSEQVQQNAKQYQKQVAKVLNFDDTNNPAQLMFNSEWLGTLTFGDLIELAANFTLQQMIERDMFQVRIKENKPIYLHEFLYPLMQGYDSVAMDVDVEIGGTDQTFNMLIGRELVRVMKNKEKFVITCKFLMGLDGEKMSKSTGNYVALDDEPFEMYRKIMTIHDDLITHYYDMVFETPAERLDAIQQRIAGGENPMVVKKELAHDLVAWLHDEEKAITAAEQFQNLVQEDNMPEEVPTVRYAELEKNDLVTILYDNNLAASRSDARRLIEQDAVSINGKKITDTGFVLTAEQDTIIKVGKAKWLKMVV